MQNLAGKFLRVWLLYRQRLFKGYKIKKMTLIKRKFGEFIYRIKYCGLQKVHLLVRLGDLWTHETPSGYGHVFLLLMNSTPSRLVLTWKCRLLFA